MVGRNLHVVDYYCKDVDSKRDRKPSWYSAFYYFAEAIKKLTGGEVNYKILWSLVGTNGGYINHINPTLRASLAPEFSRLIHSAKYADDLRKAYEYDPTAFDLAADTLYTMLYNTSDMDDDTLFTALSTYMCSNIIIGLQNEVGYGRFDLDVMRVKRETDSLFDWYHRTPADMKDAWNKKILSSYFHLLAYGCLPHKLVHTLSGETPLVDHGGTRYPDADTACLFRVFENGVIGGIWELNKKKKTAIGRYTDCEISDVDEYVSRHHADILFEDGIWQLVDMSSTHGTQVARRDGAVIKLGVLSEDGENKCKLEMGDRIILTKGTAFSIQPIIHV